MKRELKCIVLGDSGVGKTCMITSYVTNTFSEIYTPTTFSSYNALAYAGNEILTLNISDISGQKEWSNFRSPIIQTSDVIILCYSMISVSSFRNVGAYWYSELRNSNINNAPVILVGTQKDQADQLSLESSDMSLTSHNARAQLLCNELRFHSWLTCSSLSQEGLKQVFDQAILAFLSKSSQ